ncbi:MAG: hypothetical protein J6M17_09635 [Ruminococcus sp.]|nr:hypothetical protein [Ruminococcus sp.]
MELKFSTVRERDMDLLFLEAIGSDKGFAKMILDKTKWAGSDFSVCSIELSRTEADLGESDITVIVSIDDVKFAILLEDKIDAIAMPDQHKRYVERGKRGVEEGKYSDFDIIIICPQKYYNNNIEAKLYEHQIFYEECEEYFCSKSDDVSRVRLLQIRASIDKAKKPSEVNLNEAANSFFINYNLYQKTNYPQLDLRSKETSNGWWAHYATNFGQAYIYHKMQEGYVDLTFPNSVGILDTTNIIAGWLRRHGMKNVAAVRTGKSSALRIEVPQLKVKEPFEQTAENDIAECFEAIAVLSELADIFLCADRLKDVKASKKK